MKLIDSKKDHYRKLAHEQGYRSRASYKLKEINKSYRIIGPGSYVLDLGCAPGGWCQVAHQIAGNQGKILGIDLDFVEELPGIEIIRGDIEDSNIIEEITSFFKRKVDAVICDLSPNVSGNWSVDHAAQISLNYTAQKLMEKILSDKGNALFKVFDGEYSAEFYEFIKKQFIKTKLTKPKASRKPSSELYCICMGYINSEKSG
jgi:23S rRNA (uridine2552-2'-O)-methyltransferase